MTGFRLAPEARADIQETWTYIAGEGIEAAGRLRKEFLEVAACWPKHPRIGHTRADLMTRGDVLSWPVFSYPIVLDGKRDIGSAPSFATMQELPTHGYSRPPSPH